MGKRIALFGAIVLVALLPPSSCAQTASPSCTVAPIPAPAPDKNFFTEAQENDLGDVVAEHVQRNFLVIEDEDLTAFLRRIGGQVLKHMPPSAIRFQFYLFDLPVANAYTLPGGRIYVSRKLVAAARSEDELAGVMAHEIGHGMARDGAERMTRVWKKLLGVRSVGDRQNIFQLYHQFVENIMRKPDALQERESDAHREQVLADQAAMYAVAAAGYSPRAYIEFWDRIAETKGKKGSWLSDLFGTTTRASKRLREMDKLIASLPPDCAGSKASAPAGEFEKWKSTVVAYSGLGRKERLNAVLSRRVLDPPLQDDLQHLKFSPDGNFVLAQDDSSIHVLSRQPFEQLFRIDAPEAARAQFTPDSQGVVFHNADLRVEWWDIPEERRVATHEVVFPRGCIQTALSPDGKALACLAGDFSLALIEVPTGAVFFEKKNVLETISIFDMILLMILRDVEVDLALNFMEMHFSPDSRYFAAGRRDDVLAVDLSTRQALKLPGSLKRYMGRFFDFLSPDRLVGVHRDDSKRSAVVEFPSGKTRTPVTLGAQKVAAATRGEYVLLRPVDKYPVGVLNLRENKIFMANNKTALDVFDQFYLGERRNGEVGLYSMEKQEPLAVAKLSHSPLGRLRAVALSSDLQWLAVSQRSRGAVWNLNKGQRVFHVRGFRGGHFGKDGALYADFPKFEKMERNIARLDPANTRITEGVPAEDARLTQYGRYLVQMKPAKKGGGTRENVIMEVRDATNGELLWTRPFPKEAPWTYIDTNDDKMLIYWGLKSDSAKAELKKDATLKARAAAMKEKEGDYLILFVNVRNGEPAGNLLVETGKGSFHLHTGYVAGDLVVLTDSANRVLLYSLASGQLKSRFFGSKSTASKQSGLLCVENERGQLTLYDLSTQEKRAELIFVSPVSWAEFSADGKRLFVLTADQTAYVFDAPAAANAPRASAVR